MLTALRVAVVAPLVAAFALSLVLVPACRTIALRLGCVAHPRPDRWHKRPIALFGGVAIGVTLVIGLLVFQVAPQLPVLTACAIVVFLTGLVDDIVSLKPATKLVVEIAVASVFLFFGYRLNWTTSMTLDTMLTLVWVVGMTNAFNLLDNMDGLCAGLALIVGGALLAGLMPAVPGSEALEQARYLAVLVGATAGFLVYNYHPASIFMGDSGSLLLGVSFAAATLSRAHTAASANPLSIVAAPVLVLLIPILDTALVTGSRILSGRAPSEGGRDHSSHRLVAIGLSERAAVAVLWALAAVGGALGIAVNYFNLSWSGLVAALFFIAMLIFAVYLSKVRVYEGDALDYDQATPLVADFMYKRRVVEVLLDLCLVVIAYYGAYRLRFEGNDFGPAFQLFYRSLPLVLGVQMLALFGVGIYRGVWRYFGLMDTVVIVRGVLLAAVGAVAVTWYLFPLETTSKTVLAIDAMLLGLLLTASRASFRLFGEFMHRSRQASSRVVIYGAGDSASLVVSELVRGPVASRVLGFVDDDPRRQRIRVAGYPVLGGFDLLVSLVGSRAVDAVVISSPLTSLDRLRDLEGLCAASGVALSRLQVGLESLVPGDDRIADDPATARIS